MVTDGWYRNLSNYRQRMQRLWNKSVDCRYSGGGAWRGNAWHASVIE